MDDQLISAAGTVLTDEVLDRWAAEYETDAPMSFGKPHAGRPKIAEDLVTVSVRLPRAQVEAIDRQSGNRSEFIRRAVAACL